MQETKPKVGCYDSAGRYLSRVPANSRVLRMKGGVIVSKRCATCLEWYPIEEYTLYPGRYAEYCAECKYDVWLRRRRRTGRKARKQGKMARSNDGVLLRVCTRCGVAMPEMDFHKMGLGRRRRDCKLCYKKSALKNKSKRG